MAKLTDQSTIFEVWPHLTNPRQYVAGVRQKLITCSKTHGNARVIIGITGSGQKPCYRILYDTSEQKALIYGSYWDNHDALSREDATNNNWAIETKSAEEVDRFLREKIGWKGA